MNHFFSFEQQTNYLQFQNERCNYFEVMMSSLYNMRDKLLEIKILKNAEKFEYVRDSNHLVL